MFLIFLLKIVKLFDKIIRTKQFFDGLLFFIQGVYVVIIPCKKGSQYYTVHLHARATEGKPDANGLGTIIKFEHNHSMHWGINPPSPPLSCQAPPPPSHKSANSPSPYF